MELKFGEINLEGVEKGILIFLGGIKNLSWPMSTFG
jgi:hypothetical protein